jgi:hypothetical protein
MNKNKIINIMTWMFAIIVTAVLFLMPGVIYLWNQDVNVFEVVFASMVLWTSILIVLSGVVVVIDTLHSMINKN